MHTPNASPSRSFSNLSTASLIFAFLNAVAKNFADPSGSSPALNPPGNIIICALEIAFSNSSTEERMSSASKFLNTFVITFAPALSKALALSYSQFVPGNTGINTVGCPILWLHTCTVEASYNFSSTGISELSADFVANTFSSGFVHASSASSIPIFTSPYANAFSFVTSPIKVYSPTSSSNVSALTSATISPNAGAKIASLSKLLSRHTPI